MSSETTKDENTLAALGQICWLEVPCTDISRVITFYRAVLDWDTADYDPTGSSDMPGAIEGNEAIHMFNKSTTLNGAFVKMSKPSGVASVADPNEPYKASVLAYYCVLDIEETLKKVEANGGRVHVPKTAIAGGSMGYFARFIDSEGNLQAIWSHGSSGAATSE
ncbi:hypothetical protein QBC35DRAFT_468001 [Podospora australis]|uniref:VOC domain-containing protein n=1 Tax=Podospora australis TaxID=1536484 RepID=A0AAN6WLJ3_9PEZI|nr:hypothetical protein QBC35DRAFT_468001 [Podospora australis]